MSKSAKRRSWSWREPDSESLFVFYCWDPEDSMNWFVVAPSRIIARHFYADECGYFPREIRARRLTAIPKRFEKRLSVPCWASDKLLWACGAIVDDQEQGRFVRWHDLTVEEGRSGSIGARIPSKPLPFAL